MRQEIDQIRVGKDAQILLDSGGIFRICSHVKKGDLIKVYRKIGEES